MALEIVMTGAMSGARIRAVRQQLGLSQVELAAHLGVSNVTVNRWEHDRAVPQAGTIERLLRMERDGVAGLQQAPAMGQGNLPLTYNPLLGRATDLAAVSALLESRLLVTITGPAGTGKTRLALEVARTLQPHWPDGIWFIDLAAVLEPEAVIHAVARVLGVRESGRKPLAERLDEELRKRRILLVLDNCEHMREACAGLAVTLLEGGGASRLLATSRVALGVAGEAIYPLRPLASAAAAALFVARAREQQPEFGPAPDQSATVADICRRLDGLPLAIELAAARTSVLSIEQIAGRLDQRFDLLRSHASTAPRQRALDTAIAWSYDLLAAPEATLFRRLGVFVAWFDLPAVESIAEQELALDLLDALVRQSMVVVEHDGASRAARYRLLESLAEYARDLLAARGEADAAARSHAEYYIGIARELGAGLRGRRQVTLLTALDREYANLIAALEWTIAAGEIAEATALAAALGPYWSLRGRYGEGCSWLERVTVQQPGAHDATHVTALIELGFLQYLASRFADAKQTLMGAVELAQEHGGREQEARALDMLGLVLAARRELDAAWQAHEAALRIAQEIGDQARAATCTLNLGRLTNLRGDQVAADRLFHEAWTLVRGTEDTATEALILSHLGEVAARMGRYARALDYYERTLALFRAVGDPDRTAVVATNTAEVQLVLGDIATAIPLASEAVIQFREIGNTQHLAGATYIEGAALAAVGRLAEALSLFRETLALYHEMIDWIDIVYTVEAIARLFAEAGDAGQAARLLGGCEIIRERHHVADYPLFDGAGTIAAVRAALGQDDMARYWQEGQRCNPEEVVAEALHVGAVRDGEPVFVLAQHRRRSPDYRRDVSLTERQAEILRLVADGLSNREIGQALAISDRTVERHLTAIFGVLEVDRRSAAVARATALGLLHGR